MSPGHRLGRVVLCGATVLLAGSVGSGFQQQGNIIEQEFDDPIAKTWDRPEDRITREQVKTWMATVGFHLTAESDIFQGPNNPKGTDMPERWFVVYARGSAPTQ